MGVMVMRKLMLSGAVLTVLVGASASARPLPSTGNPPAVQQLIACRSITDSALRLACYDRQSDALSTAIAKKDVVVIDKARATATRRSLFGFSIPDFGGLFGGAGDDIKAIETTVVTSGYNADGGWMVKLADGSMWSQTDDTPVALPPERGDKVIVTRGMFGAYFLQLGKQPGFKVRRVG
jgi:hypothetical protein